MYSDSKYNMVKLSALGAGDQSILHVYYSFCRSVVLLMNNLHALPKVFGVAH